MRKLLYILIFLFFSFSFDAVPPPPGGWYQQFLPDVNNMPISDIEFLDSLVGFAVTNNNTAHDTGYVLRTTNGGDNWSIVFKDKRDFNRIIFINDSVGFTCGGTGSGTPYLYKTTNTGDSWFIVNSPDKTFWDDMSVLNEDTIWLADGNSFNGGLIRTTNGGQSWTQQFSGGSQNPDRIYMYNGKMGFFSEGLTHQVLFKTTNSGVNWNVIPSEHGFFDMYFIDSLIGWKVISVLKKTTDGGLNWIKQQMPISPHFWTGQEGLMEKFSFINRDTIWGVSENYRFGPGNYRGIIWKTTNGGENWGFQIPDTSIHIGRYLHVDFINKLNGWAYSSWSSDGVHTVTGGGDTTIYLNMTPISTEIPGEYRLHQNYPNPFNYSTRIKFDISKTSDVKLKVYNLLGKEIDEIVNSKISAGSYDYKFIGSELSSGIYFYRLSGDGKAINTRKMLLIK